MIIMAITVILQLRFKPIQCVFEDCGAFGVSLLVHTKVFIGFHVIAVEDVFDDARSCDAAQCRLDTAALGDGVLAPPRTQSHTVTAASAAVFIASLHIINIFDSVLLPLLRRQIILQVISHLRIYHSLVLL